MLTVSHLTHVAIRVADVERSLDFYVGKLVFAELLRLDRDGRLWLIYLRITNDQYLEIFPEGTDGPAPGADRVGYNHLCLAVPDIDRAVAEIEQQGIPLFRPKSMGADGNWQCWIVDPDGHRIELMQMMPDGLQAKAIARRAAQ
jgi:lactoylglutathione lyase